MDGLLVLDKPAGPTSHDVVSRMRRVLRESRIGHTGTLDPAATGVLALVIGKATRLARFMTAADKAYDATIRLGFATDTDDAEGRAIGEAHAGPWPSPQTIAEAVEAFRGTFLQQPPIFSAKKVDGVRSYAIARANSGPAASDRNPVSPASVTVHEIALISAAADIVTLRLTCSAGFYVRALARDLGSRLGTGAHLQALRRTRSGEFTLADALPLAAAEADPSGVGERILPLRRLLPSLAPVMLTSDGVRRAINGRDLGPADAQTGLAGGMPALVRLLDPSGELVGLAEPAASGLLHPSIVLR